MSLRRYFIVLILLALVWVLTPQVATAVTIQTQANQALISLGVLTNNNIDYAISPTFGTLTYLEIPDGLIPPTVKPQTATPEVVTIAFLKTYGNLFGIANPTEELKVTRIHGDSEDFALGTLKFKSFTPTSPLGGNIHVRLEQQYSGLRVYGGELIAHLSADGRIKSVNGHTVPEVTLVSTVPTLDESAAKERAVKHWTVNGGTPNLITTKAALVVIDPSLFLPTPPKQHLAWMLEIQNAGEITSQHKRYFVDAHSGEIVFVQELIEDALRREIYDCQGGCRLSRSEGQNEVGIAEIDDVYKFAGETYNFYQQNFHRDGLDGRGTRIKANVRTTAIRCPNAMYGNTVVNFCPGFGVLDVVAHELTHWVTSSTSRLVYQGQSGALNESFSDIMAAFVDGNWKVGEDVPLARGRPGGVLRDMSDPPIAGDPDRVCSPKYYTGGGDNGGVHKNSGVPNKAAYLITQGGSFNGYTIQGIGKEKSAKIHYQALTTRYTQASDFCTHYQAIYEVCKNLYDQATCEEVKKALDATEMQLTRAECTGDRSRPACLSRGGPLPTSGPQPTSPPSSGTPSPGPTSTETTATPVPTVKPKVRGDVAIWTTDESGDELPEGSALPKGSRIKLCYNRKGGINTLTIDTGSGNPRVITKQFAESDVKKGGCVYSVPDNNELLELGEKATAEGYSHVYSLASGRTKVSTTLLVTTGLRRIPTPNEPQATAVPPTTPLPGEPTSVPTSIPSQPTTTPKPGTSRDTLIQSLVNQVSEAKIREYIGNLQDRDETEEVDARQTRYSVLPGNEVEAKYISTHFQNSGLTPYDGTNYFQPFSFSEGLTRNTIGKIQGDSSDTVVVLGHMDSTGQFSNPPSKDPAPGADDNGTGTAVIMEAARILGGHKFQKSLIFLATSGEEQGLLGSRHFLSVYPALANISGAINVDMIGYTASDCIQFLYNNNVTGSKAIAETISSSKSTYGISIDLRSGHSTLDRSDHASFWQKGKAAVFGFECGSSNPNYHRITDTLDKVNTASVAKTTQLVVAALAQLAQIKE